MRSKRVVVLIFSMLSYPIRCCSNATLILKSKLIENKTKKKLKKLKKKISNCITVHLTTKQNIYRYIYLIEKS